MIATLNDIAEKTKLSISTVSRVLSGQSDKYRISKVTRDRVLQTAKELNYLPNSLARGLRMKRTLSLGLVVPDISNPFFAHISHSIQKTARALGYSLILCNTDENVDIEVEQVSVLRRQRVDGLIVMPVGLASEHLQELVDSEIPMVLVDRAIEKLNVSSVLLDNHRGAFMATELFVSRGHRRIAIIQGLKNSYTSSKRVEGYRDALMRHELPVDPDLIVGDQFREDVGFEATTDLLRLADPPTAILATGNLIALGALHAIKGMGLKIPEDISLITFDNFGFEPLLESPLTVVVQPHEAMGKAAAKLLVEQIDNPGTRELHRIVFMPRLIERASVFDFRPSE